MTNFRNNEKEVRDAFSIFGNGTITIKKLGVVMRYIGKFISNCGVLIPSCIFLVFAKNTDSNIVGEDLPEDMIQNIINDVDSDGKNL